MQKLIQEEQARTEKFSQGFVIALVLLVAFLSIFRVILANRLIESSESLRSLDLKITRLTAQNEQLDENLRGKESLSVVADNAQKAGFVKISRLTFVQSPADVALQTGALSAFR